MKMTQSKDSMIRFSQYVWSIHFIFGLLVLTIGLYQNGGRKYIKVNPNLFTTTNNDNHENFHKKCQRIYTNVISTTGENINDVICCDESNSDSTISWSIIFTSYEYGLCSRKLRSLPLANSLSKFPHAWILPTIPLLFRIMISILFTISNLLFGFEKDTIVIPHSSTITTSIKRLFFYFLIMQFRGWVLYVFMNEIFMKKIVMEYVPLSAMGTFIDSSSSSSSQQQHLQLQECWYSKTNNNAECHGRIFDFSDHVILFFGHYYPIMIFEMIICLSYPFWPLSSSATTIQHTNEKRQQQQQLSNIQYFIAFLLNQVLPIFLLMIVAYLNFIVLASVYSTATYFHTVPESIIGYLLSLLVQIPIGCILFDQLGVLTWIRHFVGLSDTGSERSHTKQK